jgi:hypothetical protein
MLLQSAVGVESIKVCSSSTLGLYLPPSLSLSLSLSFSLFLSSSFVPYRSDPHHLNETIKQQPTTATGAATTERERERDRDRERESERERERERGMCS